MEIQHSTSKTVRMTGRQGVILQQLSLVLHAEQNKTALMRGLRISGTLPSQALNRPPVCYVVFKERSVSYALIASKRRPTNSSRLMP